MKRFIKAVFLVIVFAVIVSFAVANRHSVRLILDPFQNRDAALGVEGALYIYLLAALFVGMFIGAFVMWSGQRRWRVAAKTGRKEAALWKREAETLKRGVQSVPVGSAARIRAS